jgi:RNA polymerase sigma-70 factor (ECF subfamily)
VFEAAEMLTTRHSLLERLGAPGDEAAWNRFVELYAPLMLQWAQRQGLQPTDADDLVQDVMTLLVQKFVRFKYDSAGKFRAWLRTVFLNKHRERCRKRVARTVVEPDMLDEIPAPIEEADDAEDRRLLVQRGLALIRQDFSPSVWGAFWQYAVCGRSPTDVAAELGLSPGTVYASKSRVLSRLKLEIGFLPDSYDRTKSRGLARRDSKPVVATRFWK